MGVRAGHSAGAGLRKAREGEKDTGGAGQQSGAVSGEESSTSMKQRLPDRRPDRAWERPPLVGGEPGGQHAGQ